MTGRPDDVWGTPIQLWAFLINGHLPAYPPRSEAVDGSKLEGTKNCNGNNQCAAGNAFGYGAEECIDGECLPLGWRDENDERYRTDPYAGTP